MEGKTEGLSGCTVEEKRHRDNIVGNFASLRMGKKASDKSAKSFRKSVYSEFFLLVFSLVVCSH